MQYLQKAAGLLIGTLFDPLSISICFPFLCFVIFRDAFGYEYNSDMQDGPGLGLFYGTVLRLL